MNQPNPDCPDCRGTGRRVLFNLPEPCGCTERPMTDAELDQVVVEPVKLSECDRAFLAERAVCPALVHSPCCQAARPRSVVINGNRGELGKPVMIPIAIPGGGYCALASVDLLGADLDVRIVIIPRA